MSRKQVAYKVIDEHLEAWQSEGGSLDPQEISQEAKDLILEFWDEVNVDTDL